MVDDDGEEGSTKANTRQGRQGKQASKRASIHQADHGGLRADEGRMSARFELHPVSCSFF